MKKILYPHKSDWAELLRRPTQDVSTLFENVSTILKNVKANGDKAVLEYAEKFDCVKLDSLAVTEAEMKEAYGEPTVNGQKRLYTEGKYTLEFMIGEDGKISAAEMRTDS